MTFLDTFGRFAGLSSEKGRTLTDLLTLRRQRNELSRLSPHMLDDLGISEHDAQVEAKRSVFDFPCRWHK